MRVLVWLISVVLLVSCTKDDLSSLEPQSDNFDFQQLIGSTSRVVAWEFSDQTTKESYNLLEVNSECDSIYVHFGQEGLLIVKVHYKSDHSFYKWNYYPYEYNQNNDVFIVKDEMLRFRVINADDTRFNFEGRHQLHDQFQTIDIMYARMNNHPHIVQDLMSFEQ